jgi:ribonuclease HII
MIDCEKLKLFDLAYIKEHLQVAGIDEAGRGPMAGPVVVAIVVLDLTKQYNYINDSKQLSPKLRSIALEEIKSGAIYSDVVSIEHDEIDRINILEATKKAMSILVERLNCNVDAILIDHVKIQSDKYKIVSITKGDTLSLNISAASILAKTTRDAIMDEYDKLYPEYGFKQNKGYLTRQHLDALNKYGPSGVHRLTFKWEKYESN